MSDGGGQGEFVSEPIRPAPGSGDAAAMSRGEPGLPARFAWRGREYRVVELIRQWKSSSPEGGRCGAEVYLRRHWFTVRVQTGQTMTLYCERQRRRRDARSRWFLYTVSPDERSPDPCR